jgi:hypothetical protein
MALLGAIRPWNCSAANCGSYWADIVNVTKARAIGTQKIPEP